MQIPNLGGWEQARLVDLCSLIARGTAPVYIEDSPLLAIGQRCVRDSGFHAQAARPHDWRYQKVLRAKHGDVLLNSTGAGTIGRSCVFDADGEFMVDSHVTVLRPNRSKANSVWLDALLRSSWGQRYLESQCFTGSTNQVELSRKELLEAEVPVPSVKQQRRIAECLDALDGRISAIDRQLSKKEVRDAAIIADLIDEYCAPPIPLARCLDGRPRNGFSPVETDAWTGVKALGLGCLTPRGFQPVQLKDVPARDARNDAATLSEGDLLMSRANTRDLVGLVGIYRNIGLPCIYPDLMMRLRCNSHCLSEFLELILRSPEVRRQIQARAQGTSESMVKISSSIVLGLQVRVPSLDMQGRILRTARMLEKEAEHLRVERLKILATRSGVAEDLLTGRVRV